MLSQPGEPSPIRLQIEDQRRFHRAMARRLFRHLLDAEVRAVGMRYMVREGICGSDRAQLDAMTARCKELRRKLAERLDTLASLGLAMWARQERRTILRKVLAARCAAWASVAKIRAEMEAEDALCMRLAEGFDVSAN